MDVSKIVNNTTPKSPYEILPKAVVPDNDIPTVAQVSSWNICPMWYNTKADIEYVTTYVGLVMLWTLYFNNYALEN